MTRYEFCGGCSNQIDPAKSMRWERADGKVLWFCSTECKVVGQCIEPSADWKSDPSVFVSERGCAAPGAKKPAKRPSAKKAPAKKPAKRAAAAKKSATSR